MSEKRYRQIRRKRKELQVEWLKTLVTDEEFKKVSIKNIETLVPQRDYVMKKVHRKLILIIFFLGN